LAFPKFDKAVSIFPSEAKALLKLFFRQTRLVELVRWQGRCTWISVWSLSRDL